MVSPLRYTAAMEYDYEPAVLDGLAGHGLKPLPRTSPQFLRDAVRELYRLRDQGAAECLARRAGSEGGLCQSGDCAAEAVLAALGAAPAVDAGGILAPVAGRTYDSGMSDATAPSAPSTAAFEKLGLFYLGRRHDPATGQTLDEPVLYDSRDLVTHAVCVGMTGSGKTGLCLGLIEEAAIDGVPVIAIDPKGDLGNLLLTFPRLRARGLPSVGRTTTRPGARA